MKNTGRPLQIFPASKRTVFFKGITVEFMMGSLYFVVIILNKMSRNQYQIVAVLNKASVRTRKSLPRSRAFKPPPSHMTIWILRQEVKGTPSEGGMF